MSQPLIATQSFQEVTCCLCNMAFCMTAAFYKRRQDDEDWFYCPSGHRQHFTEGEVQRLKRQIEAEKKRADSAEEARRWAETNAKGARIAEGRAKAARVRLERRVNCGVCPHCHRTVRQLADHVKTKHPEASR